MFSLFNFSPFIWLVLFFHYLDADIGLASRYSPPYMPKACYSEFPTDNLFAAAGEGLWNKATACGRKYSVRCINAPSTAPSTAACSIPSKTIEIEIVDRAQTSVSRPAANDTDAVLVLSEVAFSQITTSAGSLINVEFTEI